MKTYTAKTLEEVLQIAAEDKNVTVEELTYVVEEEEKGIFGLGSKITIKAYALIDIKEFIKEYLEKYLIGVNNAGTVEVNVDENFFKVNIDAENNAILIGKNGKTLESINTILKSAVSSKFKRRVRILVDINSYKTDKYQKEIAFAKRIAKNVVRSKTDATLDPMPSDERKAIHAALTDFKNIKTVSEGEGRNRRLTIKYSDN